MTEPKQKWVIDTESATATHETGLLVRFYRVINGVVQEYNQGDVVLSIDVNEKDGTKWTAITTAQSRDGTYDMLVEKNGEHNTPRMIVKLGNDALKLWMKTINKAKTL